MDGIRLSESKGINLGRRRSVEQPSCLSQRILDLGEVANAHHLENQPIDVGFEFIQGQGTVALPASWLPGDRSRGLLHEVFLVFCRWRLPFLLRLPWSSR